VSIIKHIGLVLLVLLSSVISGFGLLLFVAGGALGDAGDELERYCWREMERD
jgi:hypothetical protein